jgi:hypothetical protein
LEEVVEEKEEEAAETADADILSKGFRHMLLEDPTCASRPPDTWDDGNFEVLVVE